MALIGRGRGGKQLITQGLAEPSSLSLGNALVELYGFEASIYIGNVRASITVTMGHGPTLFHEAYVIENELVEIKGFEARATVGAVVVITENNVAIDVVGTEVKVTCGIVKIAGSAVVKVRGNELKLKQGYADLNISTSVPIMGSSLEIFSESVIIHSVDRRFIEDQELIELLLAA